MLSKPMLWSVLNESASSSTSADLLGFVRHWVFIMCFFFLIIFIIHYTIDTFWRLRPICYTAMQFTQHIFSQMLPCNFQTQDTNYWTLYVLLWFCYNLIFFSNERLLLMIFIDSLIIYASVWFKWIRIEYEEIFWI